MQQEIIFIPMLLLVLLKLQVWCYMYYTRISYLVTNKVPIQSIAKASESKKILKDVSGPSDNLINLFEMPVLFYVGVITTYVTGLADTAFLVLASSYVFLRYVHSFIHATYNQVHQRFIIYIVSTLVLWAYWILLASDLIQTLR